MKSTDKFLSVFLDVLEGMSYEDIAAKWRVTIGTARLYAGWGLSRASYRIFGNDHPKEYTVRSAKNDSVEWIPIVRELLLKRNCATIADYAEGIANGRQD